MHSLKVLETYLTQIRGIMPNVSQEQEVRKHLKLVTTDTQRILIEETRIDGVTWYKVNLCEVIF